MDDLRGLGGISDEDDDLPDEDDDLPDEDDDLSDEDDDLSDEDDDLSDEDDDLSDEDDDLFQSSSDIEVQLGGLQDEVYKEQAKVPPKVRPSDFLLSGASDHES